MCLLVEAKQIQSVASCNRHEISTMKHRSAENYSIRTYEYRYYDLCIAVEWYDVDSICSMLCVDELVKLLYTIRRSVKLYMCKESARARGDYIIISNRILCYLLYVCYNDNLTYGRNLRFSAEYYPISTSRILSCVH